MSLLGILGFWLALRSAYLVLSIPQMFSFREWKGRKKGQYSEIHSSDRKIHPFYKKAIEGLFHSTFWSIIYQMKSVSTFSKSTSISFKEFKECSFFLIPSTSNRKNQLTILSGHNLNKQRLKKGELKVSVKSTLSESNLNQPVKQRDKKKRGRWHGTCFYCFHNVNPNKPQWKKQWCDILKLMMWLPHNLMSVCSYLGPLFYECTIRVGSLWLENNEKFI